MNPVYTGPLASKTKNRTVPDTSIMNILKNLLLTQRGYATRQALKVSAYAGTVLTTWLASHQVQVDGNAITAALATLAVGLTELGLSYLANSKALESK